MTESNQTESNADTSNFQFESKLSDSRQRFLACAMEHALFVGRRSADDFIRHFSPEAIMEGMSQRPELRASILTQTTGLKTRIAAKKSWKSAAEDLRIALAEGETSTSAIVAVFEPDDRVRFLPQDKIWTFLTEGEFYNVAPNQAANFRVAKLHIAYLLDRGLRDGLLTHRDVIEGVGISELSARLPKLELGKIIESAVVAGRNKKPFGDADLWAALTSSALVDHVPLAQIWSNVLVAKLAAAHGFVSDSKRSTSGAAVRPELVPTAVQGTPREDQDWVELPEDNAASGDVISEDDFA